MGDGVPPLLPAGFTPHPRGPSAHQHLTGLTETLSLLRGCGRDSQESFWAHTIVPLRADVTVQPPQKPWLPGVRIWGLIRQDHRDPPLWRRQTDQGRSPSSVRLPTPRSGRNGRHPAIKRLAWGPPHQICREPGNRGWC